MNCPYNVKVCTKCKKILIACSLNYGKQIGGKYGLKSKCKKCTSRYNEEYGKTYYKNNKEYILERNNIYYENNKKHISEQRKQYREENPHIDFNNHVKRREREKGNGITKEQWIEMMDYFNWCCAYSGIQLNKNNRTIDHIMALDNNGEHEIWNCVPMYANYNFSKGTKDMLEWYIQQPYYSEERLQKIYKWCEYALNKWK